LAGPTRILIVGGYGTFGGRLVQLLEDEPRLTLLVAGRSLSRAHEFCTSRKQAVAQLVPLQFDRERVGAEELASLRPDLVVDASGPFQAYGDRAYRLVDLCVECRIHYLDLADATDFVAGIGLRDEAARAAGVFVLSGASSFPVLSGAVVRRLAEGLSRVRKIRGGIAPTPYAGVGLNVIRAIASYAGQAVEIRRGGRKSIGRPFAETMSFVICAPGRIPLERRRFSLVDVPDLRTLPQQWLDVEEVWMGAAPMPASLHRVLNAFAWLVRLRLLPSLAWLAGAMQLATDHLRWGAHRGGMFVRVEGDDRNGRPVAREWHLLAEGDDGPLIPSMAAEIIVRKLLAGIAPPAGARTAESDVNLSDYELLFARRDLYSGTRDSSVEAGAPLYRKLLGSAWDQLPWQIRALHSVTSESTYEGICSVDRGRNPLSRLVAALYGFPAAGSDLPVTVNFKAEDGGERWTRTIGGARFFSVQKPGRGRSERFLLERFGPVSVDIALVVDGASLRYVVCGWRLLGIPMPRWLGPRSTAFETVENEKFRFDVEIALPFAGLIVRYRGLLDVSSEAERAAVRA